MATKRGGQGGKRGGRPKQGAPYTDRGTPELLLKRLGAVKGGDPALATLPLDVILARGMITPLQHLAGSAYADLRSVLFGSPHQQIGHYDWVWAGRADIPDEVLVIMRRAYEAMDLALRRLGAAVRHETRRVVVFHEVPRWLLTGQPSRRRGRLLDGLDALVDNGARLTRRPRSE